MAIDVEALKARIAIEIVVGSFTKLVREGRTWRGACPVHGGDGQNMVVYPPKNGDAGGSYHCFTGNCHDAGSDVIGFVRMMLFSGMSEKEGFKAACEYLGAKDDWKPELTKPARPPLPDRITAKPPPGNEPKSFKHFKFGEPEIVRKLCDLDGSTLGFEARYVRGSDPDEPDKSPSRMWTWGSRDSKSWEWGMGAFNRPRPCFGLDRIADKPQILIYEGPKKADAGQQLFPGAANISWTGGAKAWKHHEWEPLRGKNCVIWPDNDEVGIKAAENLAEMLTDQKGLNCTVAILIDREKPPTWDAADALAEGWTEDQTRAWAKAHKVVHTHKSVEISTDHTESAPQAPEAPNPAQPVAEGLPAGADPESSAAQIPTSGVSPFSPEAAHALDPSEAPTGPPGDDQPPPYADIPPPEGSTPERPARARKPRLASIDGSAVRKPAADEQDDLPPALSDSALAAEWVTLHGEEWKYVADWSSADKACWMHWSEDLGGWCRDKVDGYWPLIELLCIQAANRPEGRGLAPGDRRKLTGAGKYAAVAQCVRKSVAIATESAQWDTDKWVLGIPGGWVNLRDGSIHDGDKSRRISMRASVAPKEGMHPLFDMVIERPANGDVDMMFYLWNMCGYMLTGDVSQERFFYLIGPQNSGKSTLAGVLFDILGDYAGLIRPDALIDTMHPQHTQQWAMQQNKRMVLTSEMRGTSRWSEDLVKRITDGSPITAHAMRQNDITWRPHFKLLVDGGQEIPNLQNPEGMERRLDLIEYPPLTTEKDLTLKARLVAEYPAILHSLIIACVQYQKYGLPRPQQVKDDSAEYMTAQDVLGSWIEQRIERAPGQSMKTSLAREDLQKWAEKAGECKEGRRFMSPKLFALRMKSRGYKISKSGNKFFVDTQFKDNLDMFNDESDRAPPPSYDRD